MSKVGKKPIEIPEGVKIQVKEKSIEVEGSNASLSIRRLPGVSVEQKEKELIFTPNNSQKQTLSNWGTLRALVQNAVLGASGNFEKTLIIEGVGYRANVEGNDLVMGLGFSHPIKYPIPEGISITTDKSTVTISGANKEQVGKVAAEIRDFKKPEPYKGKGIRYSDEVVRRKAGKKAVGAGGV